VLEKLTNLPTEESKVLLKKFFVKIIDLKEQEQRLKMSNNELEVQIEEQSRVIDQLKNVLKQSVSASQDTRLLEQKTKSEKVVKLLQQQLNESSSRVALLEREIEAYKEKILKLKQKYSEHANLESESVMSMLNSHRDQSELMTSVKSVKLSRKDLRPLSQEELIKRSLNKQQQSTNENF
jgi:kinesin family protein 7